MTRHLVPVLRGQARQAQSETVEVGFCTDPLGNHGRAQALWTGGRIGPSRQPSALLPVALTHMLAGESPR